MTLGLLGLPVLAGVILLVPERARKTVSGVLMALYAGVYTTQISRALRPVREVVDLHADPRGLFAGDRWLVTRQDIVEAYLRPAIAPTNVKGVQLSAWPMTVELVTTRGQLNLDGGDEPRTAQILAALGFPPIMVAANPVANVAANPVRNPARSAHDQRLWWIIAGVVVLVAIAAITTMAIVAQNR